MYTLATQPLWACKSVVPGIWFCRVMVSDPALSKWGCLCIWLQRQPHFFKTTIGPYLNNSLCLYHDNRCYPVYTLAYHAYGMLLLKANTNLMMYGYIVFKGVLCVGTGTLYLTCLNVHIMKEKKSFFLCEFICDYLSQLAVTPVSLIKATNYQNILWPPHKLVKICTG